MSHEHVETQNKKPTVKHKSRNRLKSAKKGKIIVRNLPFKNITEQTLIDIFNEYGEIKEVKLLRKDNGKLVGCGFVQFKNATSAAKAINYVNGKEVNGRRIILDWSLPKDTYLKKLQQLHSGNSDKIKKENYDEDTEDEKQPKVVVDNLPDNWASEESGDENCDEDQEDDENESDVEDDDDDGDSDRDSNNKIKTEKPYQSNDAEDGKTVFLRNIPFSATNEDLRKSVESYGPVHYALICIDKLTEHSKGTAFVKFKAEESAKQCLRDSGNLIIHDTPVTVTYALTKENLENKKTKKKVAKDSRNLYLIREGVITAGSKAAAGVSASDMSKRLQLEQWKSQILKNLNMFVSRTRLVIHNLPTHYDDAKLRHLFVKHGNPNAVIREAKVMWEKNKLDAKGKHISKEVGFVSFTEHDDALAALRNINNNPAIFTHAKRPIVAFSIENRAVINQKQKRIEKSRAKLGVTLDEKSSKLNRKQRRFIRRRQKLIERRRETKRLKQGDTASQSAEGAPKEKLVKRKMPHSKENKTPLKKKAKVEKTRSSTEDGEGDFKVFTGVTSEPGRKVKLRSRFNLKKQATLHGQTLKQERKLKKIKIKRHAEPIKQPKQKQGKRKLLDDARLSKLISKHRQNVQSSSTMKKWYET
ncbi:hypothetical protein RUM44_007797 [Polyplax serrata]|uniref:RRM domain-containing protein n=1 Tax=Polyplax serrata TaxID=468196 RepID=A0ABR1B786_POLSC